MYCLISVPPTNKIHLDGFSHWSFMFAHKPICLTVTLGICHILPLLLKLPLTKVIFSQNKQKQLYFYHFWYSSHEITSVHAKDALFLSFEASTPQGRIYSWILCDDEKTIFHLNLRHTVCSDPKAKYWGWVACAQHLEKFLTKPFLYFLLSSAPASNSSMILPNQKERFQ